MTKHKIQLAVLSFCIYNERNIRNVEFVGADHGSMADYGATSVSSCPVIRRSMVYYKRIFVCYAVLMMFYCVLAPKIHDCADL